MYFDSLRQLLLMDGHGGFVWSAYAVTVTVVFLLVLLPRRRERRVIKQLRGDLARRRIDEGKEGVPDASQA